MTGANDTYQYDAFISYSHHDKKWVHDWLLPQLESAGLRICMDFRDFEPGVPSLVNMENAVERSRKTLIVLTPAWVESEWTTFESLLIQTDDPAGRRARMIPLRLKPCKSPKRIAMLTYVDFTQPAEAEFQLGRLIAAIKGGSIPDRPQPALERAHDELPFEVAREDGRSGPRVVVGQGVDTVEAGGELEEKEPWYQTFIDRTYKILAGVLAGVLALGVLLDALSNAIVLITPPVTYFCTALIALAWIVVEILLWQRQVSWLAKDGPSVNIKRIGNSTRLYLLGVILLLWIPRLPWISGAVNRDTSELPTSVETVTPSPMASALTKTEATQGVHATPTVLPTLSPTPSLPPMTSMINIAIADFGLGSGDTMRESSEGYELAQMLHEEIRREVRSELGFSEREVEIRRVRMIRSDEDAEQLANRINATLVIWGWIPQAKEGWYEVRFVVLDPLEGTEVADGLSISPVMGTSTLEPDERLKKRAEILILFVRGLTYLFSHSPENTEKAAWEFQRAADLIQESGEGKGGDGIEDTVYFYVGRSLAAAGQDEEALGAYQRVVEELNPEYAWAYIGLGNVYYARGSLEDALNAYNLALEAPARFAGAYVDAKAWVNIGNVYSRLAQQGEGKEYYLQAEQAYQGAIQLYEDVKAPSRYPAKAYYGLGIIYERMNDAPKAKEWYEKCLENAGVDSGLRKSCQERLQLVSQAPTSTAIIPIPSVNPTDTPSPPPAGQADP